MTWQDEPTRWDDSAHGRSCVSCGKSLRPTDPGSLFRNECRECQEPKAQGPAVAFVRWQGVVLGFDSLDKAIGFVRNAKEASDPRYYCGPPVELPELIETPEVQEAKR